MFLLVISFRYRPWYGFDQCPRCKRPKLLVVFLPVGSRQDLVAGFGKVYGIAADVRTVQGSRRVWCTGVPHLDGVVPSAADEAMRVGWVEFDGKDSVGVTSRFGGYASFSCLIPPG